MKQLFASLLVLVFFGGVASGIANAQFRTDQHATDANLNTLDAMKGDGDSFLSRLFDPARFSMHQSYSMSFISGGGIGSTGISMFTNTFSYRAADNLFVSADVSAVYSPFSSLGSQFSNSLNGIYLSNARLDWKLGDNTFMRVEYVGGPAGMYGGYSPYNPFYSSSTAPLPASFTPGASLPKPGAH